MSRANSSLWLICCLVTATACATLGLARDGFRDRLSQGCETPEQCRELLREATRRVNECHQAQIRSCDGAEADLGAATKLWREAREAQQERARAAHAGRHETQHEKWLAEQDRRRAAQEERRRQIERRVHEIEDERRAEKERLERLAAMAQQPEYGVPILNMQICNTQDRLRKLSEALAEERKIEQRSGYVSPLARRQIARETLDAEESLRALKERLRSQFGESAPGCGEQYRRLLDCLEAKDVDCDEPTRTVVEILRSGSWE